MSRLLRSIMLAIVMTAVVLPTAATATESRSKGATEIRSALMEGRTALGRRLVNRYLSDIQHRNLADLRLFLSPAFQVQRADGLRQNKAEVLRNLPTIISYQIRRLRVTKDANVLVVTFQAAADEVINGQALRTGYSPRLATFIHGAKGWRILAYANFNTPK